MFTGLIEEKGVVESISVDESLGRLTIQADVASADAQIGDSISINGCCLTVVTISNNQLSFDTVEETLNRTNLGNLKTGDIVNLERSLTASDRMGGHFVTGHIDVTANITKIIDEQDWKKFWFEISSEFSKYMASKGSVAVDGVSLTLVDVETEDFSVVLIPHTLEMTTLGERAVGDRVNIETDLLSKYVSRQLQFMQSSH